MNHGTIIHRNTNTTICDTCEFCNYRTPNFFPKRKHML